LKRKVLLTHCLEFDDKEGSMEVVVKAGAKSEILVQRKFKISFRVMLPFTTEQWVDCRLIRSLQMQDSAKRLLRIDGTDGVVRNA
jgi:hypothetical protein